jgi:hypothetical protein
VLALISQSGDWGKMEEAREIKIILCWKCQHLTLTQIWSPVELLMLNVTVKPYQIQFPTPNSKAVAT